MNVLANSLKASFVSALMPTCPAQKMHFHHSSTPLKNLIENNALPACTSGRSFNNPNIFNQNTLEKPLSSSKKISQFDVTRQETVEKASNSREMVPDEMEKTDFGGQVHSPGTPSRKRARRCNSRRKLTEKHNNNRQVLNEMMDLDYSSDSSDASTEDEEMEEYHSMPLKLCDVVVVPGPSNPIRVPAIDVSINPETACFAFSISPPNARQRQVSASESEDSFIVFASGTDEECDFREDTDSDSEESSETDDEESDTDSPGSVVPTKKVRFADDKELCEVHRMIKWSFAYKAARKGPWEVFARDRGRFKHRILLVEEEISQCLDPEHRQKIFDERFRDRMDD